MDFSLTRRMEENNLKKSTRKIRNSYSFHTFYSCQYPSIQGCTQDLGGGGEFEHCGKVL